MHFDGASAQQEQIELGVSDLSQLPLLRDWLRAQSGVNVAVTHTAPGPGEQGTIDVLTVLASSSGLVAVIKTLPDFIRSRRSDFRLETTIRGEKLVLDATNVEDVAVLLERLLQ